MAASSVNALDALRTLQRELASGRTDTVPPGWRTAAGWAAEAGVHRNGVQADLNAGVGKGLVECREFRIVASDGKVRSIKHYRMKGKR